MAHQIPNSYKISGFLSLWYGCITIKVTRLSCAILLNETVFPRRLHFSCFKSCCFVKDKSHCLRQKLQNETGVHTFKLLLLLWKTNLHEMYMQSHSWHMKVLDFTSFCGLYVRQFELSHSNLVNRIIKITHAHVGLCPV